MTKSLIVVMVGVVSFLALIFPPLDSQAACDHRGPTSDFIAIQCCGTWVNCYMWRAGEKYHFGTNTVRHKAHLSCGHCTYWCYDYAGLFIAYYEEDCNMT